MRQSRTTVVAVPRARGATPHQGHRNPLVAASVWSSVVRPPGRPCCRSRWRSAAPESADPEVTLRGACGDDVAVRMTRDAANGGERGLR
jgi:hypothetical protein